MKVSSWEVTTKIVDYVCADFKRKNKYCVDGIPARGQRKLQREATGAMQALTQTLQANVHVDSIWEGVDMNMNVAKARFDDMVRPVLNEIIDSLPEHEAVDRIYVYGGTSSVPLLQHLRGSFAKNVVITMIHNYDS